MLDAMRRGAQTWVAKLLFGLLVASFAIWGVGDMFTNFGRGAIATVGDTQITSEDFQRQFRNELDRISRESNQRINAEQARALGIDRRVLAQLIGSAAIETHADRLNLALSDKTLVEGVQNDPNFAGADGKFSHSGFEAMLRQVGLSEQGFLNLRRRDELRELLIGALVNGQTVPTTMIDMIHAYNAEKRVIDWIRIDPADAVKVPEPTEETLKERYDASKSLYMTPEYRKVDLLLLTVDELKKSVQVTDAEIAAAYETSKDSYDTPEQRRIQQIAFKDRASAEAALKALRDGTKTFADVAKEAGAKDTDVDLGLVSKKTLIDPKIADVAFSLEKDKFSDVVEGRFATVILRVTQIEPGVAHTLADVKDQVKDKLAAERARADIQNKHDEVDDNRAAGKTLAEIAAATKLTYKEIPAIDARGLGLDGKPVPEIPDAQKIVSRIFTQEDVTDGDTIELADGGYAWVNVVSTEPPKQRTFEEVKTEVHNAYMATETKKAIQDLAKKLTERVNNGEPMTALEDAAKTKVQKTDPITRKTLPQGLSAAAVAQAFALAKGKAAYSPSSDDLTDVIIRVADIIPASAPTETEADNLRRELSGELAGQTLGEYAENLKSVVGTSINEAEFKSALGVTDQ